MRESRCLIVMFAVAYAALGVAMLKAQTPPAAPLAHFTFNGHANDERQGQATFDLRNTSFQDDALYLNGIYEFGPQGQQGYHAVCLTPSLRYTAFTVTLRFKAESFGDDPRRTNLLVGGTSHRWFGLERSNAGNLTVSLNNQQFVHELPGAALEKDRWTVVSCGVDLAAGKAVACLDGKLVGEFNLPKDFKLNVIGTPAETTDKSWSFVNYSNTNLFHGLVDELIIHNRLLSAEEMQQEFSGLPTKASAAGATVEAKASAPPATADFLSAAERDMLDRVNGERFKAGLPPLVASRQLTDAARGHAANMARQRILNHTLDGKRFDQRINATGYRHSAAGENILMGGGPAQAMTFWMRSPGHQRNILSPSYKEIGIGMAVDNSKQQYWTQVFATPVALARVPSETAARVPSETVARVPSGTAAPHNSGHSVPSPVRSPAVGSQSGAGPHVDVAFDQALARLGDDGSLELLSVLWKPVFETKTEEYSVIVKVPVTKVDPVTKQETTVFQEQPETRTRIVQVTELIPEQKLRKFLVALMRFYELDGTVVEPESLAQRLARPTLVVVTEDGGPLPDYFAFLFKPGTLVVGAGPSGLGMFAPSAPGPMATEPQAAEPSDDGFSLPDGFPPTFRLATVDEQDQFVLRMFREENKSVTGFRTLTKTVQTEEGERQVSEIRPVPIMQQLTTSLTTRILREHVRVATAEGKPMDDAQLDALKQREYPVVVARDGRPVDPFWLQNIRPRMLVLVTPPTKFPGATHGAPAPASPAPMPATQRGGAYYQAPSPPTAQPNGVPRAAPAAEERAASAPASHHWMVVPKPDVQLKQAGSSRPLTMQAAGPLPWKITQTNGDWLWMGKTWVKKDQVVRVGPSNNDHELIKYSEAIRTDPRNHWHHVNRSYFWRPENTDSKIADLSEAIRLSPDPYIYQTRARAWATLGNWQRADADWQEAGRLSPGSAPAYQAERLMVRAAAWKAAKNYQRALDDLTAALKLAPKNQNALAERAWILATCPDDKIRNGQQALADATAACEIQKWANTLNALAAAQAEVGDFEAAVESQQAAIENARSSGPNLVKSFEQRLALYQQQKPYRER